MYVARARDGHFRHYYQVGWMLARYTTQFCYFACSSVAQSVCERACRLHENGFLRRRGSNPGHITGIQPVFFRYEIISPYRYQRWWTHLDIREKSFRGFHLHYNDVIVSAMASQIISLTIVYSTVYSGTDQRKHPSSVSLYFVRGIHRWPVNSPHKGPVTRKLFPFDDVIMKHMYMQALMNSLWYTPEVFQGLHLW